MKVPIKEGRIKYNRGHRITVGEMSGVCGTHDAQEKCLRNLVKRLKGRCVDEEVLNRRLCLILTLKKWGCVFWKGLIWLDIGVSETALPVE